MTVSIHNATPAMRERLASHVDYLALRDLERRPRRFTTTFGKRRYARRRREELRSQSLCINGAKHGLATHGVRCKACDETHKESS